eukprot:1182258-Prorocentrum_minimum.AAC.6
MSLQRLMVASVTGRAAAGDDSAGYGPSVCGVSAELQRVGLHHGGEAEVRLSLPLPCDAVCVVAPNAPSSRIRSIPVGYKRGRAGNFLFVSGEITSRSGEITSGSGEITNGSGELTSGSGEITNGSGELTSDACRAQLLCSSAPTKDKNVPFATVEAPQIASPKDKVRCGDSQLSPKPPAPARVDRCFYSEVQLNVLGGPP